MREAEILKIDLPEGWKQLKEGIVVCVDDADWCDQDMWWTTGPDGWWLDVGTYSHEHKKYVCLALRQKPFREHVDFSDEWAKQHEEDPGEIFPDWQDPDERVELETADEVVAWIYAWFEKLRTESA